MVALHAGDPDAAAVSFERGLELSSGFLGLTDLYQAPWAEAALAGGNVDAARVRAADAAASAVRFGFPWQAGWALAAQARVALVDGRPEQAEDLVHRALALRQGIDDVAGVADVLELLVVVAASVTTRQVGRTEAARLLGAAAAMRAGAGCARPAVHAEAVEGAVQVLTDVLGPQAFAAAEAEGSALSRAEAVAYAARGRGERRRPGHGWAGLTPTEREVVGLLATGLSNKEIAARLFVSPRTVETHLT